MQSQQKQEVRVHVRWMIRRDMPEVLAIERRSFEFPWVDEDFIRCLRQRNCIGMAAEHEDRVVGFMIYELLKTRIHVLNFAVDRHYQRRGVGSQMLAKLVAKLSPQRRNRIVLEVRETNLAAAVVLPRKRLPRGLHPPRLLQRHARRRLSDAVPLPDGKGRASRVAGPHHAPGRMTTYNVIVGLSTFAIDCLSLGALAAMALTAATLLVVRVRRSRLTPLQSAMHDINLLLTRILWRTQVCGRFPFARGQGAVIVCNHRSSIDPAFIQLAIGQRVVHWMVAGSIASTRRSPGSCGRRK